MGDLLTGPQPPHTTAIKALLRRTFKIQARTEPSALLGGSRLRALHRFSLATIHGDTLDVHRLLQKVIRDDADDRDDESGITAALRALESLLPRDSALPAWWPQFEALLPHITAIADTAAAPRHPSDAYDLLRRACGFLLRVGGGERAVNAALTTVELTTRWFPADDPRRLSSDANLASSYWSAGRTGEAIEIDERVLADRERLLGPEHPDTLTARANLASSYRSAGRTGEAIELLERVLADRERLLGPEHPNTLTARDVLSEWRSSLTR
jgi:tetratricopeptide (TPR) repeat protein